MNKEMVQMFAAPIKGALKNFVEFGESGVACHQQTLPYQRTPQSMMREGSDHARQISRRSATRIASNLTPRNLPLSVLLKHTDHSRVFVARRAACPGRVSSGGGL